MKKRLIVIGGGAAGFFTAIRAKEINRGLEVLILEKQNKVLQKVKVSGGGRCNVTHNVNSIEELLEHYPRGYRFLKKVFYSFGPIETIEWFKENGVHLKKEADGRMFPVTDSSQTVIDCLMRKAEKLDIEIKYACAVQSIEKEEKFVIDTKQESFVADFICVACGGYPKSNQFDWLRKIGHNIIEPVPSLFTFNVFGEQALKDLKGISLKRVGVKIQSKKAEELGNFLITHWGLSGPCILKLSAWQARLLADLNYEFKVQINWLDKKDSTLRSDWNGLRNNMGQAQMQKHPFEFPKRLWNYFLAEAGILAESKWSELKARQQNKLIQVLTTQIVQIKGKTTFKEEFVTCGGIDLKEVNPKTMESRVCPGIYFSGEVLDIDGVTGGFNFQNAWSTAAVAAALNHLD